MLAAGRLHTVLRDGVAILRSAADDRAVAGRCARLLAQLVALGGDAAGGQLPKLAGASVELLQRGWDGSGWEGGSEAAAGGAALLQAVLHQADATDEGLLRQLTRQLLRQAAAAAAPLCSLLAAEAEGGTSGGLSEDGHTALALLHCVVVGDAAAADAAAGAGAAPTLLLQLLRPSPVTELALALLGALAGRAAGARAILSAPRGLERLAACVHDSATAKAAAGVLAALASRFPAELAQVGRSPVHPACLHARTHALLPVTWVGHACCARLL